jgi:F420-non-reducing hydrogenase iron-sulfur subunit
MCSNRVDPLWVIRVYLNGADGVLVAGCHPYDCHCARGNFYTRRRIAILKNIFETTGLEDDRLRLS